MNYPRSIVYATLFSTLLLLPACSDSSSDTSTAAPVFEADTSYLDDLSPASEDVVESNAPQATDSDDTLNEPEEEPIAEPIAEPVKEYKDEVRHWTPDTGSKSLFGRARDRAKDLSTQAQDSSQPENGLAMTQFDEEYAQAAGFAWNMPEDWRMAIPASGLFAEMYVLNRLGNASVSFTKETGSTSEIKRRLESFFTDRPHTTTTTGTVLDYAVTYFDLGGTYVNPKDRGTRNERPFYAFHAALIELPTTKVLINLWGPSDTVEQSKGKLDAMIRNMYEK